MLDPSLRWPRGGRDHRAWSTVIDGLTPTHLILVLVIALLVIGPGKLPETGAAVGRALREFRHGMDGTEPTASTTPPAPTPVDPTSRPPTA